MRRIIFWHNCDNPRAVIDILEGGTELPLYWPPKSSHFYTWRWYGTSTLLTPFSVPFNVVGSFLQAIPDPSEYRLLQVKSVCLYQVLLLTQFELKFDKSVHHNQPKVQDFIRFYMNFLSSYCSFRSSWQLFLFVCRPLNHSFYYNQ